MAGPLRDAAHLESGASVSDSGKIVIVGAGPTGLGAAWRLRELGHRHFTVLEGRESPGGLAASFLDPHGFTWDIGGHVQFSHYFYYDDVLASLPIEWLHHQRESWVWVRNRFVPYPFQNNIHRLDPDDRDRALRGLESATGSAGATNFRDWILSMFGQGIADLFLFPYNQKVWAWPLETIGTRWVGERVAPPDLDRIRRNLRDQRDDVSWGPNSTFRFPREGGTGSIWREVARALGAETFTMGARVEAIDPGRIRLADGRTVAFDTLISSMPLSSLVRMTSGLTPAATRAAGSLVSSSTYVFGVGLRGDQPAAVGRKCWMYFPESNSPYYRVTVFSNYSPRNAPDGCWSLMAEVSQSPMKPVGENTFEAVLRALREDGLIGPKTEVVSRWQHREEFGYPTPTIGRDDALNILQPELEKLGIYSRGRFGAWKYEVSNQDHSFMQGVEVVDRLLGEGEEPTLNQPELANSGVFLRSAATT